MARRPPFGQRARDAVFSAMTERSGTDTSGRASAGADVAGQLRAAFGMSKRDPSRPDTAAAAAGLGLSVRQVQRYVRGDNRPPPDTAKRLSTAARQAASTKRGRNAAVAGARDARAQTGARVTIKGTQGPYDYPKAKRPRTVTMRLDPELTSGFYNAYVDRGERGALDFLARNSLQAYNVDSWVFETVEDMNVRDLFD